MKNLEDLDMSRVNLMKDMPMAKVFSNPKLAGATYEEYFQAQKITLFEQIAEPTIATLYLLPLYLIKPFERRVFNSRRARSGYQK